MIRKLVLMAAERYMERHHDFMIGSGYLYRWRILPKNRFFNVYLHKICKDDDDRALHDHPWDNLSWILKGSYTEVLKRGSKRRNEGDFIFRRAKVAHRLVADSGPVVSLFFIGPRIREWGFHCPQGWVHWKEFTAPGDKGQIGKGCGEDISA